jgi:pimeloyl-ACP methyl ester carboxylesterase
LPALLLHCSLAHGGAWDGVARRLADRLSMAAPDLIGHGRAPARDPARDFHDQCTAQVAACLGPDPTHLIGHSFGATLALRLALAHPEQVASLTLIEPVLFAAAQGRPGWRAEMAAHADIAARVAAGEAEAAARLFLAAWGGATPFDAMPPAQRRYMAERMWITPASAPALHDDRAGLLPRLPQIACPVLLLEGARSPPVIAEVQSALAAAMPQAQRHVVAGAGHMLPITHPGPVADRIAGFLDAQTRYGAAAG